MPGLLLAPAALPAQGVVPPGLSYVTDGYGAVESTAARWRVAPERIRILHVSFVDPPAGRPDFWAPAWNALEVWEAVPGIPLRFVATPAGESSDVEFRYVDRFPTSQAGVTHRRLGDARVIEHATVTLAHTHSNGVEMSDAFLRMVALHEAGHIVGLPHSDDPGDAMHPGNRNFRLSERDLRSVAELYPADPSRDPVSTAE
ncbi:MAG: matrixin family metalloprotease [Gemmatimonadota bacterium]